MINGEVLAFALYFVAIVFVGIFFFFKTDMNGTLYGLLISCIGLLICCGISYIVNKKLPCILGK